MVLLALVAACESKNLHGGGGQSGTMDNTGSGGNGPSAGSGGNGGAGNPGGAGGSAGSSGSGGHAGTFVSCDGIGGSVWVEATGRAGSGGDAGGLLFASAGRPGTGDPCTPEGCPETIVADQSSPSQIAVDAGALYWNNIGNQTLVRMPFGGTPAAIASNISPTTPFAIDDTSSFWLSLGGAAIMKAPLNGGPAVSLVDRASATNVPVNGLTVDSTSVYWAEYRPCLGAVMKIAKAGGSPTLIASSNQEVPGPLAVDATNLYGSSSRVGVFRVPLAGGAPVVLAPEWATGVAINGPTVLWTSGGLLLKVPTQGGTPTQISADAGNVVATDGNDVFWSRSDGSVVSTPIAGGADKVLANFQYPNGLAADATSVYWTRANGAIMKVPRR
jgi:hypothetical protein